MTFSIYCMTGLLIVGQACLISVDETGLYAVQQSALCAADWSVCRIVDQSV